MLIRFVLYGLGGWCGEIVWTATMGKLFRGQRGWKLAGTTYLWTFPLYGLIAPLYEPVHDALRSRPWPVRALAYMAGFLSLEYLSGWALKRLIGSIPWDYTGRSRWEVRGYTRLDYGPVWAAVGLGLEPVHDLLLRLTPAIRDALKNDVPQA